MIILTIHLDILQLKLTKPLNLPKINWIAYHWDKIGDVLLFYL